MTIEKNNPILYQDLINSVLNLIKSSCCNIDSINASVPQSLRNGGKFTLKSQACGTGTLTATATVNDAKLVSVSSSTVSSQLDSFLSSRGIKSKPNEVMTFKGMMNFYNNISSFLATKLILVSNSFGSGSFVFYDYTNSNFTSVSTVSKTEEFQPEQMKTTLNEMMKSINLTSKSWYPTTTLSYTCSSSSSSSSSSSCSSSSSMFIAYMGLK